MAELINERDTLNEGRKKINKAITHADEAKQISEQADTKATEALNKSESTQTQLDTIVINGDSSVEAAQARVDEKGQTHSTLKDRIDDGFTKVNTQLADIEYSGDSLNASFASRLNIKTFDGSNQPYHPSIMYFSNNTGWNGYRFWMAYTPFPVGNVPPYKDRWECPSIACSHDGNNWILPSGAPNPLIDLTEDEIDRGDYFSDPDIVMNGDTMEVWYRKTNGENRAQTDIYRITSSNGVDWSSPERVFNALESENGFPSNNTMRSHQVFLNGNVYESFFSVQGGSSGELAYAETTDPSDGKWRNFESINLINSPNNVSIWHLGVYKENNQYHMTGYDINNNAIQYYISNNKTDFYFKGTILKARSILTNLSSLYQSVPVKIGSGWALYVSGTFRESFNNLRNGIALYYGESLNSLVPLENRQMEFEQYPALINDFKEGEIASNFYGVRDGSNENGFGVKFGKNNDDALGIVNAPYWKDGSRFRPIAHVRDDIRTPHYIPQHVGTIVRDISAGRLFISVGDESVDDWKLLYISKKLQKTAVGTDGVLNANNGDLIVVDENTNNDIKKITGGVETQEITILNVTGYPVVLSGDEVGDGSVRIPGKEDIILRTYESVTLFKITNRWYVK